MIHPEFRLLADPIEDLDIDEPTGERRFTRQLRVTAARLKESAAWPSVISERGPLDFLAYLTALGRLGRSDGVLLARATELVEPSMSEIDLVAIVPLDERRSIHVNGKEDPALRLAMDEALRDLIVTSSGAVAPHTRSRSSGVPRRDAACWSRRASAEHRSPHRETATAPLRDCPSDLEIYAR
ncbi:hypothetical protein ACIQTX_07595 [Microbacterium sp. NPDC090281]|uniref:hypothetical protein n=1 Tax=Microbacterium sp. NPDC090281 TaxID=3364208 RepID=UPI003826631A